MSKDQYLRMVEQTGEEIDWERCPPELDDFPETIHTAVQVYNGLVNYVFPDVGYIGKDYTLLEELFKYHVVEQREQKDWIIEILLFLEHREIKENQRRIKAENQKARKR